MTNVQTSKGDIKLFADGVAKIHALINERLSDEKNNRFPITDGPVNIERYFNKPIKVCWVLKEPYDDVNGTGGGWDFATDLLDSATLYSDFIGPHRSRATWQPIVYATYGILNDFVLWNDMEYLRKKPSMTEAIRDMAYLNSLKMPAVNVTRTDMRTVHASFGATKDILEMQLSLLDPDIIIFGGVFPLFKKMLEINSSNVRTNKGADYYIQNKKLYIDTYHPAQKTITRQVYIDGIVNAAKEWYLEVKSPSVNPL
jgi:hypothetical protein